MVFDLIRRLITPQCLGDQMPEKKTDNIHISVEDAFNLIKLEGLALFSGKDDNYLNGVINRTLGVLGIDNIEVIIRRHDSNGELEVIGISELLGNSLPKNKKSISSGKLYKFYEDRLINHKSTNQGKENVEKDGVKFFPMTGYPFKYKNPNTNNQEDLVIHDYIINKEVTDDYLKERTEPNKHPKPKIDFEYGYGVYIKFDDNSHFDYLKVFGDALKEVNDNKSGNPYIVGWSYPLYIDSADRKNRIWGFVTFYTENIFLFSDDRISKIIKLIKIFFLDFAQFTYLQDLNIEKYKKAIGGKRFSDASSYYLAAKAYESINSFEHARDNYVNDYNQIADDCENIEGELYKNINYFDSLCNAFLCKVRIRREVHKLENFNLEKPEGCELSKLIFNYIENNISSFDCNNKEDIERFNQAQNNLSDMNHKLSNLGQFKLADMIYAYSKHFDQRIKWKSKAYFKWLAMVVWRLSSKYGISAMYLFFFSLALWGFFGLLYTFIFANYFQASDVATHDKVFCSIESGSVKDCEKSGYHPLSYYSGYFINNVEKKDNLYFCDATINNFEKMENLQICGDYKERKRLYLCYTNNLIDSVIDEESRCGIEIKSANNDNLQPLINDFESEKQICKKLLVNSKESHEKWTIAGFDNDGTFKKQLIENPYDELFEELKKESHNLSKIVKLVNSKLDLDSTQFSQEKPIIQCDLAENPERDNSYYWKKLFWGLEFSAVTFITFGLEGISPKSWCLLLVMIVQILLGYFLIGVLIMIIIRKVSPRF